MSDLYPLSCPAWVALPGAYAPAGIALWVIEVLKPSHHDKGWTMLKSLLLTASSQQSFCEKTFQMAYEGLKISQMRRLIIYLT